jgi:hypothetical protein
VTGSTSAAGFVIATFTVPPRRGGPAAAAWSLTAGAACPHAARIAPAAGSPMPITLARARKRRLLIRRARSSSNRWYW